MRNFAHKLHVIKIIKDVDMKKDRIVFTDKKSVITPSLRQKIEKARKEYERNETICFDNASAAIKWMDSL